MKICVYAICKNEEKFVKRWLESMSEADYICVLDTGSTDRTVELLSNNEKVSVCSKVISPWRFDVARNESMKLIPEDTSLCVCTDLDEVFEPGWRKKLEESYSENFNQYYYKYVWNFNDDGSEGVVFYANKIHKHGQFQWKHPVHEVLVPNEGVEVKTVTIKNMQLNHHADNSKPRTQYLPLLEMSVKENPSDDRNVHYLGREYYFYGYFEKAIKTLEKHLKLKSATWDDERSASLGYIAKSYESLGKISLAEKYFKLAIIEKPQDRTGYFNLGLFYYRRSKFLDAICVLESMQNIKERNLTYMSSPQAWGCEVFDILSICYFKIKNNSKALYNCAKAVALNPKDERLQKNLEFFYQLI